MRTIKMLAHACLPDWGSTRGEVRLAPEELASNLVRLGLAEYMDSPVKVPSPVVAASPPAPEAVKEPERFTVGKKPAINEPKAKWVEHAVANGLTEDQANLMAKADLIDKFGSKG